MTPEKKTYLRQEKILNTACFLGKKKYSIFQIKFVYYFHVISNKKHSQFGGKNIVFKKYDREQNKLKVFHTFYNQFSIFSD